MIRYVYGTVGFLVALIVLTMSIRDLGVLRALAWWWLVMLIGAGIGWLWRDSRDWYDYGDDEGQRLTSADWDRIKAEFDRIIDQARRQGRIP